MSVVRHSLELRLTVKITLLKVWNSALAVQKLYKQPCTLGIYYSNAQGVERNIGTQLEKENRQREQTKIKRILRIRMLKV